MSGRKRVYDTTFYVYRFVDAADDSHDDGRVEFVDTTNDGHSGVQRERPVEFRMPASLRPSFSVAPAGSFSYSASPDQLVFDPSETRQDLTATLTVHTPGGGQAGTLEMVGDGELLRIHVDESLFETVLVDLANGTPGGNNGADTHELTLIDNLDASGSADPDERRRLITAVINRERSAGAVSGVRTEWHF